MSAKKKTPSKVAKPHAIQEPISSVKDGVFGGKAVAIDRDGLSEHTPLREDYVYLNPDVMTAGGFVINQIISVSLKPAEQRVDPLVGGESAGQPGRSHLVLKAWPVQKLSIERAGICKSLFGCYNISDGQKVEVEKLKGRVREATEVCIVQISNHRVPLDNAFKNYFLRCHEGRHVYSGNYLTLQYFGNLHIFSVVSAEAAGTTTMERDSLDGNVHSFGVKLASLSLNDSTSASEDTECMIDTDSSFTTSGISTTTTITTTTTQEVTTDDSLNDVYKIGIRTKLVVNREDVESVKRPLVTFSDVAGLDDVKSLLCHLVKFPLENSNAFASKSIELPRAIILTGPPGTGKSLLCNALRNEVKTKCFDIDASVTVDSSLTDSVKNKIAKVFEEARQSAPSLVIIEDLHQLCPHQDLGPSEVDRQLTAGLVWWLEALHCLPTERMVIVMATTSAVEKVDVILRRPGRFDKEIEVPVPTATHRIALLRLMVSKLHHDLHEDQVRKIAELAHGHVGADLRALCMEAQQIALASCLQHGDQDGLSPANLSLSGYCVSVGHFMDALHRVRPSAMREVQVEVPKVHWSDIGGQEDIKSKLKESVEWPLKHPEAFVRLGIKPPKGVLLYGPPGCSKTMIARALATESRLNFLAVKGPELFSKYVGDSERAVRQVFHRARSAAPSIIFFDEIDALAVHRKSDGGSSVADRVLAQLLTEMDGVEYLNDVLVVAATNRPDMIDKALLRPGRIDRVVYVPLPDEGTRREIFNIQFKTTPIASDVDVDYLVEKTAGYSGAEIVSVCQEAALSALHDSIDSKEVEKRHFDNALETVCPQTEPSAVHFYESYSKSRNTLKGSFQFGSL